MPKRLYLIYGCLLILLCFIAVPIASAQETISTAYVAWHPDGQMIAVAYVDHIDIVEVSTMKILNTFDDLIAVLTEPIWNPNGELLGFGNATNFEIWQIPWDAQLAQQILVFENPSSFGSILASSWNPNGKLIALAPSRSINLLDLTTNTIIPLEGSESHNIDTLAWDIKGEKLAVGRNFKDGEIWDMSHQEIDLIIILESYLDISDHYIHPSFYSIDWSPDNQMIVYGATGIMQRIDLSKLKDAEAILAGSPEFTHDFYVGKAHSDIDFYNNRIFSVDWNPNGKLIANGGEDGTIRIWNAETGEQIQLIDLGDNVSVKSVAWSPDGTQLAYGGLNGEIILADAPEIKP